MNNLPGDLQDKDIPGNRLCDIPANLQCRYYIFIKRYMSDLRNGKTEKTFKDWLKEYKGAK